MHDLTGNYLSLRTYATLDSFEVRPLHASANEAQMQLKIALVDRGWPFRGHTRSAGHQKRTIAGNRSGPW